MAIGPLFHPSVRAIPKGDRPKDKLVSDPQNWETPVCAIAMEIPGDNDRTTERDQITQIRGEFIEHERQYSLRC